jgi:hypothetical protein
MNQSTGCWEYDELVPTAIDNAWLIGVGQEVLSAVCGSAAHLTRIQAEVTKFSICSMRGSKLRSVDDM